MQHPFFNIFATTHFKTEGIHFGCVFDSYRVDVPSNVDVFTHVAEVEVGRELQGSILVGGDHNTSLKDISLLLSLAQGTHVFCNDQKIGRISNHRKTSFALFLADEIGPFLDSSLTNLRKMNAAKLEVIKTAIWMFYEATHLLFYDGLKDILMMNCFEFLIGSIYRQDKNDWESEADFKRFFSHIITQLQYQRFIDEKLSNEVTPELVRSFKKANNVSSIGSFSDQFRKMRNWISHGKQGAKPCLNSPSDCEFTFLYRLESLIRIILVDLIYGEEYKIKFLLLYQLILEQAVCPFLPMETPKLRFVSRAISKP